MFCFVLLQMPQGPEDYSSFKQQNHQSYLQQPATTPTTTTTIAEVVERRTAASDYMKQTVEDKQPTYAQPQPEVSPLLNSSPIYPSPGQYPPPTYGNSYANGDRARSQVTGESPLSSRQVDVPIDVQKYAQQQPPPQLLSFQQNLPTHESLYQTGFQPPAYPVPNARPVYPSPHYFDAAGKPVTGVPTASVKKRE